MKKKSPRPRSPMPPPSRVIDKKRYRRSAAKRRVRKEVEEA